MSDNTSTEPAETLADILAEMRERRIDPDDREYDGNEVREWANRIEAASRPDPDTIAVNRDDLDALVDYLDDADAEVWQQALAYKALDRLRAALAAAGLPQEPE